MHKRNTDARIHGALALAATQTGGQVREASGMEGGAARCQKCAQMSDELTRNLREKADDKQEIRKLDKLVSELKAQVAQAEGKAQLARTSLTEKDAALATKDANIAELESTLQMMMEECAGRSIELDQLRPKV
jgi:hypothetical protein